MTTIGWAEARRIAQQAGARLDHVELALPESLGFALAEPLAARSPLPSYDAAAMDGYAVAGCGPWRITGRVLAGDPVPVALLRGCAVEIATGATVPADAEAVLPYERAIVLGDVVAGEIAYGKHIRRSGEDCAAGRELLRAGTVVTPPVLGLAASVGHDRLVVHRRPRVGVVITGAELLTRGLPAPGRVRDAISPMLPGLVHWAGGDLAWAVRPADDKAALTDALRRTDADVLVVCGATSVGAADHLRGALEAVAARVQIHGVACRPGHPQLFAVLPGDRFIVGLPGNPYAALVAALTLLEPLLGRLSGRLDRPAVTARLAEPVATHQRDTLLVAVSRAGSSVVPIGRDRPGLLWGAACADALAVIPPAWNGVQVELLPLPDGRATQAVPAGGTVANRGSKSLQI
jgi:molybdopterin molybdotransferase